MAKTATYHTNVSWTGEHRGRVALGNGPEMDFSAPPDAHGHAGVLTPEDAFVAALNTCVMMMFLWAAERFKLELRSYECRAEGTKIVELDRTETFTELRLAPVIELVAAGEDPLQVEKRARRALEAARKYSLVANSVTSKVTIEPEIRVVRGETSGAPAAGSRPRGWSGQ
jgi:organic hydroperoxide reductase OsmC/OhrA